jgi:hypothetical protein
VTHDPRYARHAERTILLFDGRVVDERRVAAGSETGSAGPADGAAGETESPPGPTTAPGGTRGGV